MKIKGTAQNADTNLGDELIVPPVGKDGETEWRRRNRAFPPGPGRRGCEAMTMMRFITAAALLLTFTGAASAEPARADRHKPSNCDDVETKASVRELATRSLRRQNLEFVDFAGSEDGVWQGDKVCVYRVTTNFSAASFVAFVETVEGIPFTHVLNITPVP